MKVKIIIALLVGVSFSLQGVAEEKKLLDTAYMSEGGDVLIDHFAPVFLVESNNKDYNKIGTPSARFKRKRHEEIYIDTSTPTLYTQTQTFTTKQGTYTNLIYRVHFAKNPFAWVPFNVSAGKNVGAFVVITLDSKEQPVFITTVQSCGCYHAIVPTNYLKQSAYAEKWSPNGHMVYGEYMPGLLEFDSGKEQKLVVTLRSGNHRTKGVSIMETKKIGINYVTAEMKLASITDLKVIPLGDSTTSFYHERGRKKGLVKGAYKPMETVLFGLWAWDSHVGQDREYGPKEEVGHRFYTTLQFSKKKKADMWDYAGYLRHNGWKP